MRMPPHPPAGYQWMPPVVRVSPRPKTPPGRQSRSQSERSDADLSGVHEIPQSSPPFALLLRATGRAPAVSSSLTLLLSPQLQLPRPIGPLSVLHERLHGRL